MRKRRNSITKIIVGNEVFHEPKDVKKVIVNHFKDIYNVSNTILVTNLYCNLKSLSEEAEALEKPFSMDEIFSVLTSLDDTRAPGPQVSNEFFSSFHVGSAQLEISHIQFTDDLIIFSGANETEIRNVIRLLWGFELALSLKVNLRK
ncbi:hypothetical protein V6N13_054124 [Hibiscus sabdariffa]